MSTSSFSPDELRAAAEVHSELGPDYRDHVVESFLDKVGREIDARVDARLNGARPQQHQYPPQPQYAQQQFAPQPQPQQQVARPARDNTFALAIISMALGIPLTGIVTAVGNQSGGVVFALLLVIWTAIAVINVSHARNHRHR